MRETATDYLNSIVFVHGLQGHPFKTWAAKIPSKNLDVNSGPPTPDKNDQTTPKPARLSTGARLLNRFRLRDSPDRKASKGYIIKDLDDWDRSSTEKDLPEEKDLSEVESPGPQTEPGEAIFWPGDLLPAKCPNSRILTWGYDTVVAKGWAGATNKGTIFSHAKDLLFALKRDHPPGRRIIFVAHSLGGIVVKEVGWSCVALPSTYFTVECFLSCPCHVSFASR